MPGAEAVLDSRAMELGLRSRKQQRLRPADASGLKRPEKGTISQMQNADRAQKNLKKSHPAETAAEAAKDIAATGLKTASSWSLTSFWGSVWLDWTLLSLLYLNVHMFASLLLPEYICQLGEDRFFGKWLPEKTLAKVFEIIMIVLLDALVLTVIGAVLYGIYYLIFDLSLWDKINIGAAEILPGRDTGATEAASRALNP